MPLILSNTNTWVDVQLPVGHDPSWRASQKWMYAVRFQAAEEKGVSVVRAVQIAEAIVNRSLYPGLVYERSLEEDITKVSS